MKQFVLCVLLNGLAMTLEAQNNISLSGHTIHDSVEDRCGLNKNLWSHTHSCSSKTDKPILDFNTIENWVSLGDNSSLSVSPDGKYFAYTIRNSWYKGGTIDSLIIQTTNRYWRKSFAGVTFGFFSSDASQYIFQDKDALHFVGIGTDKIRTVQRVVSYKKPTGQKVSWIAYKMKDNNVVLLDLLTGKEHSFSDVANYSFENSKWLVCQHNSQKKITIYDISSGNERIYANIQNYEFDASGTAVVLLSFRQNERQNITELQYLKISNDSKKTIWSTNDINTTASDFSLDAFGNQVVFTVQVKKNDGVQNSIWHWGLGMEKAVERVTNATKGVNVEMKIKGKPLFTDNGKYIRFSFVKIPEAVKSQADAVQMEVWSYKDSVIYSKQLFEIEKPEIVNQRKSRSGEYWGFMPVEGGQIISESDQEQVTNYSGRVPTDFVIMAKSGKNGKGDRFWKNGYYTDSNWLVSLLDGSRQFLLLTRGNNKYKFSFSPDGNYLVYFDSANGGNFFSYNTKNKKAVNISALIPAGLLLNRFDNNTPVEGEGTSFGIACWQEDSNRVWVYDRYDIWQLDLAGKERPVNITNGYGRSHHIIFRLMGSGIGYIINPIRQNNNMLLKAYNKDNKYSGFYRLAIGKPGNPEKLFMGPFVMEKVLAISLVEDMIPRKASDVNVWIVKKQSDVDAPNYFMTKDFKTFNRLTNVQPQQRYNWLSAELRHYKQLDGRMTDGVLYKPENFDPLKKYPVIIVFYTRGSDRIYCYPSPAFFTSPVTPLYSPGWLVSHGYLVFMPDIDFSSGYWGPNTMNAVDGAAHYLSKLPFVDGKHIGASGHSNSGRFGYYLLTHSVSFAAMCIGSGTTDMISTSLSVKNGESGLEWAEVDSYGKGLGSLWQNKRVWLDHTAVLNADKVVSPLLLFHNKNDGVDVQQAIELFTALRRLEKSIWWLQYDGEGHVLSGLKNLKDFTLRFTQFFDHYLKGAPAPQWMTQGIRAAMKGIETGYDLDSAGNCGMNENKCKVCNKWNEQFKRTPEMFSRPISDWYLDKDLEKDQISVSKP